MVEFKELTQIVSFHKSWMMSLVEVLMLTQVCFFLSSLSILGYKGILDILSRLSMGVWSVPIEYRWVSDPVQRLLKTVSQTLGTGKTLQTQGFKDIVLVAILVAIILFRPKGQQRK